MVKRPKSSQTGLGKNKKKVRFDNEEILSDEAEVSEELNDEFFENIETAEEKRIRLAKEVIKKVESVAQSTEEMHELLGQTGVKNM